ncbi:lytic polysaccharide monooxygenase [Streptomyces sp. NPDC005423]|uniref:lytic polysaccharide monooxygenase auxiliary activity family 9 protein n=1 Tax=Streptomyces sp. NPDC005423 TaxID=3155343 RepID=UPI0033B0F950
MDRMTAHRTALAAAAVAPLLLTVWAAGPAQAHGAPTYPVSRVYACSPDGAQKGSTACRAAVAANGAPFTFWDNVRVGGVNGRDRQVIPDGKLCSGGLPAYKGLDLARSDWPSTRLGAGTRLTMTYASTIAHTGTFRLYLTKPGYDSSKPLTWSDIPARPFAAVTDPPLTGGAYRIGATLPAGRTGHQVLLTIWQNSSTEDTYYSCSDVVLAAAGSSSAGHTPAKSPSASPASSATAARSGRATPSSSAESPSAASSSAAGADAATPKAEGSAAPGSTPVASTTDAAAGGPSAPLLAGGAAAVLVLTGGAALVARLRRR